MSVETFSSDDIATASAAVSDASSASTSSTTPEPSAAPPTTAPESTSPRNDSAGEPPQERWPDILENTRKKTRAEVEAEYSYAKGVDRSQFEVARSWLALADRDPMLALDRMVQAIAQNPQQAPQLKSYFGRLLAGSQARQAPSDAMPGPDIPTSDSNGQPVVYSAQQIQKLLAWQERQFQQTLDKRFGPIEQERQHTSMSRQADSYAEATMKVLKDRPGFKDNAEDIIAAYQAIPLDDPRTEGEKLRDAYLEVVGSKFQTGARQQAVADLTRKASATTINPASGHVTESVARKGGWSVDELARDLEAEFTRRKGLAR